MFSLAKNRFYMISDRHVAMWELSVLILTCGFQGTSSAHCSSSFVYVDLLSSDIKFSQPGNRSLRIMVSEKSHRLKV